MKGVACIDKPTEYHPYNFAVPLGSMSFSVFFSSLFWFSDLQLQCLPHFHRSNKTYFQLQQAAVYSEKALINPL